MQEQSWNWGFCFQKLVVLASFTALEEVFIDAAFTGYLL